MRVQIRHFGSLAYAPVYAAMSAFTAARDSDSDDEFWMLQHPPVYTLGKAGKREHILAPGDIPVVHTDRGGQVTYHGPGQLVCYTLVNVLRLGFGPRELVRRLEQSVISCLAGKAIVAERRAGAPGVYVAERKIAALGLRIRKGASYHGIALNVAMDLAPFNGINPCGYAGLEVTQVSDLNADASCTQMAPELMDHLLRNIYSDGKPDCVVHRNATLDSIQTKEATA